MAGADVFAKARPRTERVRLCLRGDLIDEHARLEEALARAERDDAMSNEPDRAPGIAREIVDLEAEIRANETEFVFEALGKRAWSDLMAEHPASDEDRKVGAEFNPETFPLAAVAACLVEPQLTVADIEQAMDERKLSTGQWDQLWMACLVANGGAATPGESRAALRLLRGSEQSSPSALDTASPEASSSDE